MGEVGIKVNDTWILKNSQGVVEMCERLNRHKSRDRARKSNMKTFDFEQMYTNIELDALVEKMDEVVALGFRKQRELTRDTVLELSLDGEHKWLRNKQPVHKNSAKRVYVDEAVLRRWIDYLVRNTYLHVGSELVVQQCVGLPMGTNCAVHLANYFLFGYEYDFVRRAVSAGKREVLEAFRWTLRFIDDLVSVDNPLFRPFCYFDITEVIDGLAGIYPKFLNLKEESNSELEVDYIDTTIYRVDGVGPYRTRVFDKRDKPPLLGLETDKFPHASSFLSSRSKYGVLTGQLHRFLRINSTKGQYAWWHKRMIRELSKKGYSPYLLRSFSGRFVTSHRYMYGLPRGKKPYIKWLNYLMDVKEHSLTPPPLHGGNAKRGPS